MRRGRRVLAGCALALAASLLLARVHPFGNAGLGEAQTGPAVVGDDATPADVRATLTAKCADCHSTATRLPVYDRVAVRLAPVSWLLERDVVAGRKAMNLSAWDGYSADQQQMLVGKIVQETKERRMPLVQYRTMHWKANVTDADVVAFTRWMRGMQAGDKGGSEHEAIVGDAGRGEAVFEKRCSGCHALEASREGPRLRDVFGRTSGQVAGFDYSPALVKAHIAWNETTLEQWLTDPDALVPGNNMDFRVPREQERQDLIRFLKDGARR
jgi:cytochrome c